MKYSKADNKRIANAVRNFNRKIDRRAKNPKYAGVILPQKQTVKGIKERIEKRSDLQRELNVLSRAGKKDAFKIIENESGLRYTNYQKRENSIKVATINRKRSLELRRQAEKMVTAGGMATGQKRGQMWSNRDEELRTKKNRTSKARTRGEFEKFNANLEKLTNPKYDKEKMQRYKDNYKKGLLDALGGFAKDLIPLVDQIDGEKLLDLFYENQEASIDFIYDPIDQGFKAEIIKDILTEALERITM